MSEPLHNTAEDYNKIPYRSVPYSQTQPACLAALAQMFSLTPPDVKTARVLELGCASGGNILPLALRYPDGQFTGIDLSDGQVATAQKRIADLGLTNIKITLADIADADFGDQVFDYIVVHGVYSWVPKAAQEAIFRIARDHMAEDGILYVSYNTYPGWNMRSVVREICSYHAGASDDAEKRVARARWMLDQLGEMTSSKTPYGQMLSKEADQQRKSPDSYILGEFLADYNDPCYFHEFVDAAGAYDLKFFSEVDIGSSVPENLGPDAAKLVRSIAGESGIALEQYMDFFLGRQFRRSLLVKSENAKKVRRKVGIDPISKLHFSSFWRKDESSRAPDGAVRYKHGDNSIKADTSRAQAVFDYMQERAPASFSFPEIAEHLRDTGRLTSEADLKDLAKLLLRLSTGSGMAVLSEPVVVGRAADPYPHVHQLARYEAINKQSWVTNLRHAPIELPQMVYQVLPTFDGTKSQDALVEMFVQLMRSGAIKSDGKRISPETSDEEMTKLAHGLLASVLGTLELQALLMPGTTQLKAPEGAN
ncbi:methyltransferase regulatory domain-containing protein [Roseobacteraceae bacterium S113]